ncbi:hypothetical protein PAF17_09535 [Paracoccus sp. Z330]|uniref:CidA/LrgA family protein n=1 Tax=Paracoccus onchidii TaxID=3017813 RepID=A0ABT4ZGD9_9RHOB|nr:hypothetical protein [Paracoccus onchidii]MDB6177750.1 hypothetical protein [Paracoccus onchidii]
MRLSLQSSALHMAVAFLLMGGWAAFANRSHPLPQMLLAGFVQGSLSALITLGLKRMLEALSARLQGLATLIMPPLLALGASALLLSVIHRLAGTPEILPTIVVPLSVTTVYSAAYTFALWSRRNA